MVLAVALAPLIGCGLDLSGLPGVGADLDATPAFDGGATSDALATDASSSDATSASDALQMSDTAGCVASGVEVCTDGMDNDCNGWTDCADPACTTGFTCKPEAPSGWTAIAYSNAARPACPAGYGGPQDLASSASASCSCACTTQTASSCAIGTVGLASNGPGACPATASINLAGNNGACGGTSLSTVAAGTVRIAPLGATQAACTGVVTKTIPAIDQGRACTPSAAGAGCLAGGACSPVAGAPFASCIAKSGPQVCPPGYSQLHAVGTGPADGRNCAACTCASGATCTSPKFTFYTDGSCMSGAHDLTVDNNCDSVTDGNGNSYASYKYTATVLNGSCQKTADTSVTGSLTFAAAAQTICCP